MPNPEPIATRRLRLDTAIHQTHHAGGLAVLPNVAHTEWIWAAKWSLESENK